MQSKPYVEVAKVAVYEYATSKYARDAPSRAGGEYFDMVAETVTSYGSIPMW